MEGLRYPRIGNLPRNVYARWRRITLSGGSGSSLVFVVVLSQEQLVGKASGNGEGRATAGDDNPVTHIPAKRVDGGSELVTVVDSRTHDHFSEKGEWRLVVADSNASSNASSPSPRFSSLSPSLPAFVVVRYSCTPLTRWRSHRRYGQSQKRDRGWD